MADEIMNELWDIKDNIAREHGYDIDALITNFQERGSAKGRQIVDLHARKISDERNKAIVVDNSCK
jgi:hypothetical protein